MTMLPDAPETVARRGHGVVEALTSLAWESPLRLRVAGQCMAPLVPDGAIVEVSPARFYWPGDVLALARTDGQWVLHRLLGYRPRAGQLELVTSGDAFPVPDVPVVPLRVIGRVCGGKCAREIIRVPLRHRVWAMAVFLNYLAGRFPVLARRMLERAG